MLTDSFLTIGSLHKTCEDYIVHGSDPIPFVILSDGCSSSPLTDFGSRFLVMLARKYLVERFKFINNGEEFSIKHMVNWIIRRASMLPNRLSLNNMILDATLIVSFEIENIVYVYMYGDGCVLYKNINGENRGIEVSYPTNMPYYPSYLLSQTNNEKYKEMNEKKNIIYTKPSGTAIVEQRATDFTELSFDLNNFNTILIASDGITSFDKNSLSSEMIDDLLDFKGYNGPFVTKRIKKVIKNFKKVGVQNYDDISIGGFHVSNSD